MRTSERGQAAIEFAIGVLAFAIILAALVGLAPVYLEGIALQSEARCDAGISALGSAEGADDLGNAGGFTSYAHPSPVAGGVEPWAYPMDNMPDEFRFGEWYGNGTLAVKGGKSIYMRSMPNDINVRLEGDGTKVILPNDARFFDYAKCVQYCVWRRPYSGSGTDSSDNYSSYDLGLEVEGLSVPTLTVTNGAPSIRNLMASRTVAVGAASVLADGVWDNATTVDSALATIGSLAFADNAIWHVTLNGAETVARTFAPLTLPSTLRYQFGGTGKFCGEIPLISGATALAEPTWTAASPTRQYLPQLTADGTGIFLRGFGTTIVVR